MKCIHILPDLVENFNHTPHGTMKLRPVQLMETEHTPEVISEVQQRIMHRAQQNTAVSRAPDFDVGNLRSSSLGLMHKGMRIGSSSK